MPRSSRSKSHKQSKHTSKDLPPAASGSDEDVRTKERGTSSNINNGKEDAVVSVRVSKDLSVSGERRKHGKDKDKDNKDSYRNGGGSDERWNGGSSEVINVDEKEPVVKVKGVSKSGGESKSGKSSRRHDGESASAVEKDEGKSGSGSRGEKRKSEKESGRKESGLYKEYREYKESKDKEHKESKDKDYKETKDKDKEKEKEKDRGSDRGRKGHSDKVEVEALSKQVETLSSKRGKEITEWPIEEELRNPELEKELEKRMRRRGEGYSDKDKYQDTIKDTEDRQLSKRAERSKDERHKNEEYADVKETRKKDEKHREDGERDRKNRDVKHRGESERYNKYKDEKYHEDKYREDGNKETKYKDKDDKYVEVSDKDERSRDRKHRQDDDRDYKHKEEKRARDSKYRDVPEAKRSRDDNVGTDLDIGKTYNRDGSPVYDDRAARYKDDKDRRRVNEKDEAGDYRSRSSMKEQRSETEKRSSVKADSGSEWGRPSSRYADVETTISHSRRRSSPSGSSYPARDHHRFSKQEETKNRDYAYEDRARQNVNSSRDYDSASGQADKKVNSKDDGYVGGGDLSGEKRLRPESRSSPQVDKPFASTSNERRNLLKSDARKSLDLEEPGPRSASKDTVKDGKGSRDLVNEAHPNNDPSQVDNDNISVSSPYTRNSHYSANSKSLLPPPSPSMFRTGSDGPPFGSMEDDRSKSNVRNRRMVDQNMNRGQNQGNWNNVPNWPSPMPTGGYIPFQHAPQPMFHPFMQQYPPQIFGRPPMKLNPGLPYPVPDHGRPHTWRNQANESGPPPLHSWDANNAVFGDESHLYGRVDWDPRNQLNNRGWDQSGEMWNNQNAVGNMEMQSGQQKDSYSGHKSNDENWSGPTVQPDEGEPIQLELETETLNLDKIDSEIQKVTKTPQIFEVVKEDSNALISQAYLSRVDVSKDLTEPELFDQCTSMMKFDPEALSDDFDCKILFLEEGVDADFNDSASLFSVTDDSVFQKAMFLYKKQKEESRLTISDKEKGGSEDNKSIDAMTMDYAVNKEESGSDADKSAEEVAADDTVMEDSMENNEPPNKPEETMNIEVDPVVVKQDEQDEPTVVAVKENSASSAGGILPSEVEDASESTNDDKNGGGSLVLSTDDDKNGGGSLMLSDVSTADVAAMPTESVEFGLVNLNRIHHHSPESTH